ncbi:hypothetical protein GQ600_12883 [Phytophthora cactorum]|nr:hypothetical protein GQ600_12883 [Phytophthora cactorum]
MCRHFQRLQQLHDPVAIATQERERKRMERGNENLQSNGQRQEQPTATRTTNVKVHVDLTESQHSEREEVPESDLSNSYENSETDRETALKELRKGNKDETVSKLKPSKQKMKVKGKKNVTAAKTTQTQNKQEAKSQKQSKEKDEEGKEDEKFPNVRTTRAKKRSVSKGEGNSPRTTKLRRVETASEKTGTVDVVDLTPTQTTQAATSSASEGSQDSLLNESSNTHSDKNQSLRNKLKTADNVALVSKPAQVANGLLASSSVQVQHTEASRHRRQVAKDAAPLPTRNSSSHQKPTQSTVVPDALRSAIAQVVSQRQQLLSRQRSRSESDSGMSDIDTPSVGPKPSASRSTPMTEQQLVSPRGVIVAWLEQGDHFVQATAFSTLAGVYPRRSVAELHAAEQIECQALCELAAAVNAVVPQSHWNGEYARQMLQRYLMEFRAAARQASLPGFTLSTTDEAFGIRTIEDKLNLMCPHFVRLQMLHDPRIRAAMRGGISLERNQERMAEGPAPTTIPVNTPYVAEYTHQGKVMPWEGTADLQSIENNTPNPPERTEPAKQDHQVKNGMDMAAHSANDSTDQRTEGVVEIKQNNSPKELTTPSKVMKRAVSAKRKQKEQQKKQHEKEKGVRMPSVTALTSDEEEEDLPFFVITRVSELDKPASKTLEPEGPAAKVEVSSATLKDILATIGATSTASASNAAKESPVESVNGTSPVSEPLNVATSDQPQEAAAVNAPVSAPTPPENGTQLQLNRKARLKLPHRLKASRYPLQATYNRQKKQNYQPKHSSHSCATTVSSSRCTSVSYCTSRVPASEETPAATVMTAPLNGKFSNQGPPTVSRGSSAASPKATLMAGHIPPLLSVPRTISGDTNLERKRAFFCAKLLAFEQFKWVGETSCSSKRWNCYDARWRREGLRPDGDPAPAHGYPSRNHPRMILVGAMSKTSLNGRPGVNEAELQLLAIESRRLDFEVVKWKQQQALRRETLKLKSEEINLKETTTKQKQQTQMMELRARLLKALDEAGKPPGRRRSTSRSWKDKRQFEDNLEDVIK